LVVDEVLGDPDWAEVVRSGGAEDSDEVNPFESFSLGVVLDLGSESEVDVVVVVTFSVSLRSATSEGSKLYEVVEDGAIEEYALLGSKAEAVDGT
jgi:hypothetical protein